MWIRFPQKFHSNFRLDSEGKIVEENRIKTELIYSYVSNKNYIIALEASGGTFEAASKLEAHGHQVLIVNPSQFKAIGLNGKKSDKRDAKAIATALRMGFIPEVRKKNLSSRQLKALIKSRDFVVKSRTSLICHIRGILREFGLVIPAGVENFYEQSVEKVQSLECVQIRNTLLVLLDQIGELKTQEQMIEKELKEITKEDVRIANLAPVMTELEINKVLDKLFDDSVVIDWASLFIKEKFGLKTCKATIEGFEDQRVLVVERFDRRWLKDDGKDAILRIP